MIVFPNDMQTIKDFQAFHRWLDERNAFNTDIFFNMVLLSGELGEVAQVLKQVHWATEPLRNGQEPEQTLDDALATHREDLGQELADCLAYIFKLANYSGVDLQEAYLKKMAANAQRTWQYLKKPESSL